MIFRFQRACFYFSFLGIVVPLMAQPRVEPLSLSLHQRDFIVELARAPEEWAKGLMYREKMPENQGMLFVGTADRLQSFWMKNTLIPLDIIFIDAQWKIVSIAENAEPLSESSRRSEGLARHVLEINAGLSKRWGFKKGMALRLNSALRRAIQ